MGYASNIPNLDPEPWERPTTGERFDAYYDADLQYRPRDEYKEYPVQEPSILLKDFRKHLSGIIGGWDREVITGQASWWLTLMEQDPAMESPSSWGSRAGVYSTEDIAFSTKVLKRLAGKA